MEGQSRSQDFRGHTDAKSAPGLCRLLVARTFLSPAFPRFVASTFPSSSLRAGSVPGTCFLMRQLSSSNSLAHGKQRVCVEDFAEFFAVIHNHEEEIERNRTVRRLDHGCPGAIRVYRIGPGVRGETGIKRRTVDDYVLSSREIAFAIKSRGRHSHECRCGRKAGNVKQDALSRTSVFARQGPVRASSLVRLRCSRLGHGRRS
jgi:hypothetical protein